MFLMMDQTRDSPDLPIGDLTDVPHSRRWETRRPVFAGFVSMAVHAVLMVALGLWTIPAESESGALALASSRIERPEELLTEQLADVLDPTLDLSTVEAVTTRDLEAAETEQPTIDPTDIGIENPTVAVYEAVLPAPETDLLEALPFDFGGDARAVVAGSQQAIDRITEELIRILFTRNALVIWCFDQSNSMKPDRDEIRQRVRKIYAELDSSPFAHGDALLTAVTSFGKGFMVHTERPTNNMDQIEAAIDAVPVDESGVELICQAVSQAIATHSRYATQRLETDLAEQTAPGAQQAQPFAHTGHQTAFAERQLILILVTDESGDRAENLAYLEKTIETAKKARCRIYVMGREASFGCPYALVRWTDPQTKTSWSIPVDRGPETAFLEVLQFDGFGERADIHLSGFGPYDQARMAQQTGGIFFLLPTDNLSQQEAQRRQRQMERLRDYVPEIVSRAEYTSKREKSPLRRTIWQIVSEMDPSQQAWMEQVSFLSSLPVDQQRFAASAKAGATAAKSLITKYDRAIDSLEQAGQFRTGEPRRRWQANYDLLLAQLVAYRARSCEYLACLQAVANGPPVPKPPPTLDMKLVSWSIRNAKELGAQQKTKSEVDRATKLLQDVIKNHPDTPWASRAGWELRRPFGYQLVEVYRGPPKVAAKPKPPSPAAPSKRTPAKPRPPKPKL